MKIITLIAALLFATNTFAQTPDQIEAVRIGLQQLEAEAARLRALLEPELPSGPIEVAVPAGADLQAALDLTNPNQVLVLASATYTGNFVIRVTGTKLRGVEGTTLLTTNAFPALSIAPGTNQVTLTRFGLQGAANTDDVFRIGRGDSTQNSLALVPTDILVEEVTINGVPGTKNGISMHGSNVTIRNSRIENIRRVGQESHGIVSWNGPGPYLIENNYIEAASINVLFGGANPSIPGMLPTNITFRNNTVVKNTAYRGQGFAVKNLFEIKAARTVNVSNNTFRYNWVDAQDGYAIVLKVSNPSNFPTVVTEDIVFENNVVTDVSSGVNIQGHDYNSASGQFRNLALRNNFFNIDKVTYGGGGTFLQMGSEPAAIAVLYNTVVQNGDTLVRGYRGQKWDVMCSCRVAAGPVVEFTFIGNAVTSRYYGFFTEGNDGTNRPHGQYWQEYFPGGVIDYNLFSTDRTTQYYPTGNTFVSASVWPFDSEGYANDSNYRLFGRQR